jgi:hypothetical protein
MNPDLTSVAIESLDEAGLVADVVWWRLYNDSFPPTEREPPEVILAGLRAGVGLAARARQGRETIALGSATLLTAPPAVFLSYIATDSSRRGTGVGGALFRFMAEEGARRLAVRGLAARGMLWEVERPDAAADPGEQRQRERRLEFFRRGGGLLLARPYLQPALGSGEAMALHLMYRPATGAAELAAAEIEALVRAVYREKYAALNGIPEATLAILLRQTSPPPGANVCGQCGDPQPCQTPLPN